ncbi:MAG: phosphate ABC transporter permease PstA [Anaerolineales bacterium]|nr:phosphate ABC transporter permease PstA [Anaerolineales bacterium]
MSPIPASLPEGDRLRAFTDQRHRAGLLWQTLFLLATCVGILALTALLYNVVNNAFGYVVVVDKLDPATLTPAGQPLEALSHVELVAILQASLSTGAFNKLAKDQPFVERTAANVLEIVYERVVKRQVQASYPLTESLFGRAAIEAEMQAEHPDGKLVFRSWLTPQFLTTPMSSQPEFAGVRTALLGSLLLVALTMAFALPVGIGAAIYLHEYASQSFLYKIIETNIYNLAGVPSIVYGMLGLAVFVRTLEAFTSGALFGVADSNGRTIVAAAMTMALLILPIIIVNAKEAIRAVPDSFRQAAYGLGATKWQTIWHHVLPNALPGILTGSILAVSRAIGETAPLVVVGASTFITVDPDGLFSKFTALPIQIYNWTARPQAEFRNIAAAAILVLLAMLLTLNASAIILRNRFSRRLY